MAVVVTIAGVDRTSYVEGFSRERAINVNAIARLTVFDPLGVYIPGEREALVITVDGTDKFVGVIVRSTITFWSQVALTGVQSEVEALGGNFLMQRIIVNGILTGPQTLKSVLQWLPLSAAGVTLDATQADGDTLDTLTFPWTRVDAALAYLSTLTAWIYDVDVLDQLKMWAVGSVASGITFNAANGNIHGANWGRDSIGYRNYQVLVFGPNETLEQTEAITADGVATSWELTYKTHVSNRGYVTVTGADLPLTDAPHATLWSVVANALPLGIGDSSHSLHAPTGAGAPAGGTAISLIATYQFPDYVINQDAAEVASAVGMWAVKDEESKITDALEAFAFAAALRRRFKEIPKAPVIPSLVTEVTPGETATITIPPLALSGTFLAVSSRMTYARGHLPAYETTFVSGEERPQHWAEWWMQQGGGASGGSGGVSGGGIVPVGTGPIFAYLGGSLDLGVTGASGRARSAMGVKGAPYDGRTVTPLVTGRVENAGESLTPEIQDETGTPVSTGTAITATTDTEQALPAFDMESGRTYYLHYTMGAATDTGYEIASLYA